MERTNRKILEELTFEIFAERTLKDFDSKKFVVWAVAVMELGFETENLYILAGLDYDSTEEREEYFWKCIEELELEVEKDEGKLINKCALIIANRAIRKEIDITYALSKMVEIVWVSDYDRRYLAFYTIDEDWDSLKYDNSTRWNSDLTKENLEELILEEMKLFVQMENLKIPIEERDKSYCKKCGSLNIPVLKNKYQFKKPFNYKVWSCGICGSEKLKFKDSHEVKRIIIEDFKEKGA